VDDCKENTQPKRRPKNIFGIVDIHKGKGDLAKSPHSKSDVRTQALLRSVQLSEMASPRSLPGTPRPSTSNAAAGPSRTPGRTPQITRNLLLERKAALEREADGALEDDDNCEPLA